MAPEPTTNWALVKSIGAWLKAIFHIARNLKNINTDVEQLKADVARLKDTTPKKPLYDVLVRGVYYGRHGEGSPLVPYCPSCWSSQSYVPLNRSWRERRQCYYLTCPKCKVVIARRADQMAGKLEA